MTMKITGFWDVT